MPNYGVKPYIAVIWIEKKLFGLKTPFKLKVGKGIRKTVDACVNKAISKSTGALPHEHNRF